MKKEDKEQVVAELTERLQAVRDAARGRLSRPDDAADRRAPHPAARERRAASPSSRTRSRAGPRRRPAPTGCSTLLEGPSAIAFLEADGDMVAAAKALADAAPRDERARDPRRHHAGTRGDGGGGRDASPSCRRLEVLHGQVLGAIIAPLTALAGLLNAPLQNLHGLIDARIEQLGGEDRGRPEPERRGGSRPAEEAPQMKRRPRRRRHRPAGRVRRRGRSGRRHHTGGRHSVRRPKTEEES